jgi:hypothetical protein
MDTAEETPPRATEDFSAYEKDAVDAAAVGSENILARITISVREWKDAQGDVTSAEEALKAAQQREKLLREGTLPELMKEAGQELLRTADGDTIELTETLRASIPVANRGEAFRWLEEHGQAAIIKRALDLKFGKDETEKADKALGLLLEAGFTPTDNQTVHPQTLAAAIREMSEAGEDVPMELLGAYVQSGVKLKPPKK